MKIVRYHISMLWQTSKTSRPLHCYAVSHTNNP